MKKLMLMAVLGVLIGAASAFAGGYDPCTYPAYQFCAEQNKVWDANKSTPNGRGGCVVDTRSATFKQCEKTAVASCRAGVVLDTTVKPCN